MRLVPTEFLKEDSYIAINVIDNDGKLMLKGGRKITLNGIDILKKRGVSYVYIYDEYCFNKETNKYTMQVDTLFDRIIALKAIAHRVIDGTSSLDDVEYATIIATKIVEDILLFPDDFKISYEPTKLVVNSIIEQTIYVAIMSTVLGAKMQLSKDKLVKLCLSALLKDVALLSPKINQTNRVSYQTHPVVASTYLQNIYNIDEEILEGILQHHEYVDGSGYPNQLKGSQIGTFAKIISIIDCFYEVKANHAFLNNTQLAFEHHFKQLLLKFDIQMIGYFIKNSEVFTPDTLVKLNTDDIGVIIKNSDVNPFKPTIKIIKSKIYSVGETIDLQKNTHLCIKSIEYYVEN